MRIYPSHLTDFLFLQATQKGDNVYVAVNSNQGNGGSDGSNNGSGPDTDTNVQVRARVRAARCGNLPSRRAARSAVALTLI